MSDPFEGLFDSGEVLERVGVNLTTQARRGDLEPVRCRDAEIARVVDIVLRQSKNNPALIGKAGVGKTAIVEGLAQRVAAGDVPPALKDVRVVALDHVALLAGTTFRGQYEERIRKLVRELSADPDLILFVDELHNLIGQGTALGAAMDAANMLKPALVRGDIRIIGATTGGEYDKWIRGDPALERRFQPVMVEELDAIQTWEVLVARRPRLERHHAVAITDDALKAAIVLTDRFVPERARPDKAIDVLDEACAHAQATAAVSPELDRLIRERRKVDAMIRRGLPRGGGGGPGRSRAAPVGATDDARRRAGDAPALQAAPRRAAPLPRSSPRLRDPQVRRRPAAGRARGRAGRLPPVRPHPGFARPAAQHGRPAHRAGGGLLRPRLERPVHSHRHRSQPDPTRDLSRAGACAAASVPEPRLAGRAQGPERPPHRRPIQPPGPGDPGPAPGADAGAADREPAQLLGPAHRTQRAAAGHEGVRQRAAVASRVRHLSVPQLGGVRRQVLPGG